MWNVTPTDLHDWSALKAKVAKFGVRNSLLLAPMPTASTAQILGNNEGIEAYTSNIYTRRVLSGEFQVSCCSNGLSSNLLSILPEWTWCNGKWSACGANSSVFNPRSP